MRNKAVICGVLALALGVLACAVPAPGQAPNALGLPTGTRMFTPSPTPNALGVSQTGTPAPLAWSAVVREPLAVRAGAGEEYQRLGYLDPGDSVTVYNLVRADDGGLWASIDGGYVNSKFLDKIE